jgi:hypothetical protein
MALDSGSACGSGAARAVAAIARAGSNRKAKSRSRTTIRKASACACDQGRGGISGTNVRGYDDDGNAYYEVNSDKKFYCGAARSKGKFALVVTLKGPTKNVLGKIG